MAGKPQAPLVIPFFRYGLYTNRQPMFSALVGVGVSVVQFHDALIDGVNIEVTDRLTAQRRPAFTQYCTQRMVPGEIAYAMFSVRNLEGVITNFLDTNLNFYIMTPTSLTSILTKSAGSVQSSVQQLGDITYICNGVDSIKWDGANVLTWGIAAPSLPCTLQQTLQKPGFWSANTIFTLGQSLLDSNGNIQLASAVVGNSGSVPPVWNTVSSGTVVDNGITFTMLGGVSLWGGAVAYQVNNVILDPNNNLQYVTTAGTTGTGIPTWNATFVGTTTDGTVTWTNAGPGVVLAYSGYKYVYAFRKIDGALSTASPVSTSTGPILDSVPLTPIQIASYSVASNIVTFYAPNTLSYGKQLVLEQFGTTTAFNGQTVQVLPAGLSTSQFAVSFAFPNTPRTYETGVGNPVIAVLSGEGSDDPDCNATATVTNVSVLNNEVTVTCVNDFVPGLAINMSGLINATFLNGITLYIDTVDGIGSSPSTQFTASYETADYGSFPDTGTATFFAVEIYRIADGGGKYYFDGACLNPAQGAAPVPYTSSTSIAQLGTDITIPGAAVWVNPNNVTSSSAYATNTQAAIGSGGDPNFNVIQQGGNYTPGTTTSYTFPNPVTVGNSLIIAFGGEIRTDGTPVAPTVVSVSDSLTNSYSLISSTSGEYTGGGSEFFPMQAFVYAAPITTGGTCTITVVTSSAGVLNSKLQLVCHEVSGMLFSADVSGAFGGNLNSGQGYHPVNFNTSTITTTNANDVLFSVLVLDAVGAGGVLPAGWTNGATSIQNADPGASSQDTHYLQTAYEVVTATGTYTPEWYCSSGTGNAVGLTCSFKLLTFGVGSDALNATQFGLAIPSNIQAKGITISFDAKYNGGAGLGTISAQLLSNGAPVGSTFDVTPTSSNVNYILGGSTNLWGDTWLYTDFNNPLFGVQFVATQQPQSGGPYEFYVRNVKMTISGHTGGVAWGFQDTAADADLNIEIGAPLAHLNDPPPGQVGSLEPHGGTLVKWWNSRFWIAVGSKLYMNAGPDCLNGLPPDAWPPANVWDFPGTITGLAPSTGGLIVTTNDEWWAIMGGPTTISFYPERIFTNFGLVSQNCLSQDGDNIYAYTTQKQLMGIVGPNKSDVGLWIANLLANGQNTPSATVTPWDPGKSYLTVHRNGEDSALLLSNDVESIVRYSLNINSWSNVFQPYLTPPGISQSNIGSVSVPGYELTTSATVITGGLIAPQVVTPASMADINVGTYLMIDDLGLSGHSMGSYNGIYQETVLVTAVTETTFSARFIYSHPSPENTGYVGAQPGNYYIALRSVSVTLPQVSNVGDTIIASFGIIPAINNHGCTVLDNAGNVYNEVAMITGTGFGNNSGGMFYAINTSASQVTVTLVFGENAGFMSLAVDSYVGTYVLDKFATEVQSGTGVPIGPSAMTASPNELIYVMGEVQGFAGCCTSFNTPAGYTNRTTLAGSGGAGLATYDMKVTAEGTFSADLSVNGNGEVTSFIGIMATFIIGPPPTLAPSAGALKSIETSPGIHTLLLTPPTPGGYVMQRNLNAFQDFAGAFPANTIIGNIDVTQPGEPLAPLHAISAYMYNVGNIPTVSFMPNEFSVAGLAKFTVLPTVLNEPPQLPPSQTVMAKTWPVAMNQSATSLLVRHVQIEVDFGDDTVKNELARIALKFDGSSNL